MLLLKWAMPSPCDVFPWEQLFTISSYSLDEEDKLLVQLVL
jgi:hypothetical protein